MTWRAASRLAKLQGSSQPVSISLARALAPPLPRHWQETMLNAHVPTGPIITVHSPASTVQFLKRGPEIILYMCRRIFLHYCLNIQIPESDHCHPQSVL